MKIPWKVFKLQIGHDFVTDRQTDGRKDDPGKTICLPTLQWGDIIMRQKGSFSNWYKMMGIIKTLKCCQNLYQVIVCPCRAFFFFFFFSNNDPGLTLTIFMTGSNLFLILLYRWQLIEHWVLLYFQVCSNSAYPQHSGEQYRTNGPLVHNLIMNTKSSTTSRSQIKRLEFSVQHNFLSWWVPRTYPHVRFQFLRFVNRRWLWNLAVKIL